MIVGTVGNIGSGKDTVAEMLIQEHGFHRVSFAGTLKDACASIFSWDREYLEGKNPESRTWREQVDEWWAEKLGIPHLTPRWVLQNIGTDVMRTHFHPDIWIASVERQLQDSKGNVVISDVRFPNEIMSIHNQGGQVWRVMRGKNPLWWNLAISASEGKKQAQLELDRLGVHRSEWEWACMTPDHIIHNDSTLEDLHSVVESLIFG